MKRARILVLAAIVMLAACEKKEVVTPIAVWESDPSSPRHTKLILYSGKCIIEHDDIVTNAAIVIRGDTIFWIVHPDEHGRPEPGTNVVPFAEIRKDRSLALGVIPGLIEEFRSSPYVLKKMPNQQPQQQRP